MRGQGEKGARDFTLWCVHTSANSTGPVDKLTTRVLYGALGVDAGTLSLSLAQVTLPPMVALGALYSAGKKALWKALKAKA